MTGIKNPEIVRLPREGHKRRWFAALAAALLVACGLGTGATTAQAVVHGPLYGTATDQATGFGIRSVEVVITDDADSYVDAVFTASDGSYDFATIPGDGNYKIHFYAGNVSSGNYASMFYPSSASDTDASAFALSTITSTNIDMALTPGSTLSGHVSFGGATHSVLVAVYLRDANPDSWEQFQTFGVNGAGNWSVKALPAGYYRVVFIDLDGPPTYVTQYFPGMAAFDDAQILSLSAGSSIAHVDASLSFTSQSTVRLAGGDRFATNARVAQQYSSSNVVFVANGLNYADALSAGPAAAQYDAPVLLTTPNAIPSVIKDEIVRLNPSIIYVVGGTGVVSEAVFQQLEAMPGSPTVTRYWGADRYKTSQAIYDHFWGPSATNSVFLADGRNFPDALSAVPAANVDGGPVLLVNGSQSTMSSDLFTDLNTHKPAHIYLAGGTGVVSTGIENQAATVNGHTIVTRLAGLNRYLTSQIINESLISSTSTVFLAVGTGFPDALSGAAIASEHGAPLYLVHSTCVPQKVLDDIDSYGAGRIVLLGGTGVLSAAVANLHSCGPGT